MNGSTCSLAPSRCEHPAYVGWPGTMTVAASRAAGATRISAAGGLSRHLRTLPWSVVGSLARDSAQPRPIPSLSPANPWDSARFPTFFALSPTTTPARTVTGPETPRQHRHETAEFQRFPFHDRQSAAGQGVQAVGLSDDIAHNRAESPGFVGLSAISRNLRVESRETGGQNEQGTQQTRRGTALPGLVAQGTPAQPTQIPPSRRPGPN